ncbi:MAG: hypothetical protein KGQ66_15715 [Acidobacteriota bacterium]|nr:hypothetical protein [Acidobacteriota bacterium]
MAKLSVSVPDDVVAELRGLAEGNVSAFVTAAIRHEVDRRRLFGFLAELDDELGPLDDSEVATFMDVFAQTARTKPSPPRRANTKSSKRAS